MMTWTKVHLETMNILQLKELKKYVDEILKRKIEQSKKLPDEALAERYRS